MSSEFLYLCTQNTFFSDCFTHSKITTPLKLKTTPKTLSTLCSNCSFGNFTTRAKFSFLRSRVTLPSTRLWLFLHAVFKCELGSVVNAGFKTASHAMGHEQPWLVCSIAREVCVFVLGVSFSLLPFSLVGWFSALQCLCMHRDRFSISPGGFSAREMLSRWFSIPGTPKTRLCQNASAAYQIQIFVFRYQWLKIPLTIMMQKKLQVIELMLQRIY